MSDIDPNEVEFEGGFFDEAGDDVSDIPNDPFGFGNEFWPIRIVACGKPKITVNGDKVGMMVKYILDDPAYANHWVQTKGLGNGNWQQLPVPKALQGSIPWDPKNNPDHKQVQVNLKQWYIALGIPVDEMGKQNEKTLVGKGCLAKISVKQDEGGFWQFRPYQMKAFPDGQQDYTGNGGATTSTPNSGMSEEEMLRRELAGEA